MSSWWEGDDEKFQLLTRLVALCLFDDRSVFPPDLFHTLTGLEISEIHELLPDSKIDLGDRYHRMVAYLVLANLVNYPHRQDERIIESTGCSRGDIAVLKKEFLSHLEAMGVDRTSLLLK